MKHCKDYGKSIVYKVVRLSPARLFLADTTLIFLKTTIFLKTARRRAVSTTFDQLPGEKLLPVPEKKKRNF